MNPYRTTTALVTLLVLGGSGLAAAQGPQGVSQSAMPPQAASQGQGQGQVAKQLQQAEQGLRQAQQRLSDGGQGGQQPDMQPVRQALTQAKQALGQMPLQSQGQDAYEKAQQQLTETQDALQGNPPNRQRVATRLREAADALAGLHRGMGSGSTAAASGPQQQAAGMPLMSVQNLIGTNVVGADGKDTGEIQNLLIDGNNRVRAAVVEWGGFLGIGDRSAVVPIDRIQLGSAAGGTGKAELTMTKGELEKLPRYDSSHAHDYGREQGWGDSIRLFR